MYFLGQVNTATVTNAILAQLPADVAAALNQPEVRPYADQLVAAATKAAAPYAAPVGLAIVKDYVAKYWPWAIVAAVGVYAIVKGQPHTRS